MTRSELFGVAFSAGMTKAAKLNADVKLQPHQQEGIRRSRGSPGMILNWPTGAGKTPGTIAIAEDRGGRVLAVVPAALRENYRQGVKQFTTKDRHDQYDVVSHQEFANNPDKYLAKYPNTVVVDEVHRYRNSGKLRKSFEAQRGRMPFVLGATASLINNRPEELVPLVNMVSGRELMTQADFKRQHLGEKEVKPKGIARFLRRRQRPAKIETLQNAKGLKGAFGPYVHRYSGDPMFESNFPKVKEQVVNVDLTKRQQSLMKGVLRANPDLAWKIKMNLPPNKKELEQMNSFSVALRQISNNPGEFDTTVKNTIKESPKFQAMLREQTRMAKSDPNFRAVVFSNFLQSGVKPLTEEASRRGLSAATFTGGMNDKQRAKTVNDFNTGKTKVLGLSPAGGEGLDLKGVKAIQLAEDHWNPEQKKQVQGRGVRFKSHAHLPPDERQVVVQRFIAKNPKRWYHHLPGVNPEHTIDEWIDTRRREKERLNSEFLKALAS